MICIFNASFPARNITCGIAAIKSPRIPPNCIILNSSVFENFILADKPFAKALRIFETCVSVNLNLCRKLVSLLEFQIKFDKTLQVPSDSFFIANFNLLSWRFYNFTFIALY